MILFCHDRGVALKLISLNLFPTTFELRMNYCCLFLYFLRSLCTCKTLWCTSMAWCSTYWLTAHRIHSLPIHLPVSNNKMNLPQRVNGQVAPKSSRNQSYVIRMPSYVPRNLVLFYNVLTCYYCIHLSRSFRLIKSKRTGCITRVSCVFRLIKV